MRPRLIRWLASRDIAFVAEATANYERYWTPASATPSSVRRPICQVRTSGGPGAGSGDGDKPRCARCGTPRHPRSRMIAPVRPFLRHLFGRNSYRRTSQSFSTRWPARKIDQKTQRRVAAVRQVSSRRQASCRVAVKLRQPLRRVIVEGAEGALS